jgi:predicted MPP superfamily phosphohydrolase
MPTMSDLIFNATLFVLEAALVFASWRESERRQAFGPIRVLVMAVTALCMGWIVAVAFALALDGGGVLALRFLAWTLFLHLPLVILAGARRLQRRRAVIGAISGAVALWAVGGWAFGIEPLWLEVTHRRIEAPGLVEPLRIAVLSDFQTDEIGPYERRVLRTLADIDADLVLLAGDYLHELDHRKQLALQPLFRDAWREAGIHAPLGGHAGEGVAESADWPRLFHGLDVVVHDRTETVDLGPLMLTTLSRADSRRQDLVVPATPEYHVTLGHSPDFALADISADLLVAGHTHGGQVRVPWFGPPVTRSAVPRDWAAGLTGLPGGRTLIVSRGTGLSRGLAPRMRLFCRPELVVLELVPGAAP